MKTIIKLLFEVVKGLTYKWILAIISIIGQIIDLIKEYCKRRKLPHGDKNATGEKCVPIDHPSFHRADPLIYSQRYLKSLGLAVTYNNPDIILLKNGVIVTESQLLPNTEYEIDATIWNNSYDAPVVGMKVDFTFLSFGAGTTKNPIGNDVINVGVKGGSNHPSHAKVKWVTPPAGHYCLQVDFNWDDDLIPENNMGQNNVNVVAATSPAVFNFDLMNDGKKADNYNFKVDTYTIPERSECSEEEDPKRNINQKWKEVQALHNPVNYPIPPGWTVDINPNTVTLQPNQSTNIQVSIEPPNNFTGEKAFNINPVSKNGRPTNGVTLIVTKN